MNRAIGVTSLALAIGGLLASECLGEQREALREFMRAKLRHSQKVLEGLVLEDFDLVAKHSQELSLLSLAETWQVLNTMDYIDQSRKFRAAADALTEAAKKKDLDQATSAANLVTTKCVQCHKYVRGVRMARVGDGLPLPAAR